MPPWQTSGSTWSSNATLEPELRAALPGNPKDWPSAVRNNRFGRDRVYHRALEYVGELTDEVRGYVETTIERFDASRGDGAAAFMTAAELDADELAWTCCRRNSRSRRWIPPFACDVGIPVCT